MFFWIINNVNLNPTIFGEETMSLIIFMICLAFVFISYGIERNFYNPTVLFSTWWGMAILSSSFKFGRMTPSFETYLLLLLVIATYLLFSLLFSYIFKKNIAEISYEIVDTNDNNRNKIFIFLLTTISIVILIFLLMKSFSVIRLLGSGFIYENIRYFFYYTQLILQNNFDVLFNNFILEPYLYFSLIFLSINFFEKKLKLFKVLSCSNIIMYCFISGARTFLFYGFIVFFIAFIVKGNSKKIHLQQKAKYILLGLILVSAMVLITFVRGGDKENILFYVIKTIVTYLSSSFIFLEIKLNTLPSDFSLFYGRAFLGGLFDFIIIIINNLLNMDISTATQKIGALQQGVEYIGDGVTFNAFPTMIYSLIFDFGINGVFIGVIFFSLLTSCFYVNYLKSRNNYSLSLYLIMVIAIMESTLRWSLIYIWPYIVGSVYYLLYLMDKFRTKVEK